MVQDILDAVAHSKNMCCHFHTKINTVWLGLSLISIEINMLKCCCDINTTKPKSMHFKVETEHAFLQRDNDKNTVRSETSNTF